MELDCSNTEIQELPELPIRLDRLRCADTRMHFNIENDETIQEYNERWNEWRSYVRCQERCKIFKEDLMMNVWHPRRIEKLIDTYGIDILEEL
jgi:hypothetical protein